MIDMISRGPAGHRLGARHRPRERRPQRAAALQLGALPGGARLHRQGVDDAGPVPLGGRALPLPLREPVGAALPEARTRRSGSRASVSRNTVKWAAEHRYPYVMLATELEPTTAVVRLLRRVREGERLRGRHAAPRLPLQGPRRRDRGAGRGGRRASTSQGPSNPFLEGQPGQRPARSSRTCRA